jgi:glycosyltransferase involved in cell wall biosynthesis
MEEYPLVSVIIRVLNGEAYVGAALDSVLAQGYRPIDVVIVDGGSTDRTVDVVSGYPAPVRLYCELAPGAAAGRQRGVMESRGSFLSWTPTISGCQRS